MRLHKTWTDKRNTYVYEFYDFDGNKKETVISPGENGVTEVDIKSLHYKDDYEVDQNNAYLKSELTASEKAEREAWKQDYIRSFEFQYGYKPNSDDVKYQMDIHFGSRSLISIEKLEDELENETFCLETSDKHQFEDELTMHILSLLQKTSDPEKFEYVYKYFLLADRKHVEIISKDLGVSAGRVSQIASQIEEIIATDKKIQKFYESIKKINEINRLEIREDAK